MRLFIATTFPADVLRLLNERVAPVRPKLPPASWVRPETQHLTFAFLGEQPDALVDRIAPLLTSRLHGIARFEASLRGCGFSLQDRRPASRRSSFLRCSRDRRSCRAK